MKLAPAISLGLSVILGVAALVIGRGYLFSNTDTAAAEPAAATVAAPAPRLTRVLVAAQDIAMADAVTDEVVTFADWPADILPPDALKDVEGLQMPNGAFAFSNGFIAAGEPILQRKLAVIPPRVNLSTLIPDGMRAVSISVTMETGVAGFVLPGDRVDLTAFVPSGGDGPDAYAPRPLLDGVLVLAVDQNFDDTAQGALPSSTVTMAMTPAQALLVTSTARDSRIGLMLIGKDESERMSGVESADLAWPRLPEAIRGVSAARPEARAAPRTRIAPKPKIPSRVAVQVVHGTDGEKVSTPNTEATDDTGGVS